MNIIIYYYVSDNFDSSGHNNYISKEICKMPFSC